MKPFLTERWEYVLPRENTHIHTHTNNLDVTDVENKQH